MDAAGDNRNAQILNQLWDILLSVPYGQTITYGSIARRIADAQGLSSMSAQAVGGAVGAIDATNTQIYQLRKLLDTKSSAKTVISSVVDEAVEIAQNLF